MTQTESLPGTAPATLGSPEHLPPLQYCQVVQVLSGDCIVIRPYREKLEAERTLAFSNINAPRLERRPTLGGVSESQDEPYAWEAREFVRQKLIGQTVAYSVDHSVSNLQTRDYGVVYLGKSRESENLSQLLVSEGLAEVRKTGNRQSSAVTILNALEDRARAANKGKWNVETLNEHVRSVRWSVEPLRQFVDEHKGKSFKAVVENVRDGCTVRAFLLPHFYYVTLCFTGIKTPVYQFDQSTGKQVAEPLAEEAKSFVEKRLLHRDVEVVIEGLTGSTIMASVKHLTKGNIAPYLLEDGLAKVVEWSISSVSQDREKYTTAEKNAKALQKGIWKDFVPAANFGTQVGAGREKDFTAIVVEINSADTISVLKESEEKKIKFSSLRGPRQEDNTSRGKNFRPLYQIPCMFEAREFLRQRLIGERVLVAVDYVQPANEQFPEATCCTVTMNGHNIAEALVSKGLATVVRHRRDDDHRSRAYEDLLNAESKAQKDRVGLYSANKSVLRVADLCGEIKLARNFESSLKKGNLGAVVEFVAAAARLRLYVKSETCVLSFLLAGVDAPKPERQIGNQTYQADPLGDEARKYSRQRLLQRDVTFKVEAMDRAGNFIGWLFTKENQNFNVMLVREGFATVSDNISDRHESYPELVKAESEAKAENRNLWALPGFKKDTAQVEAEPEELDMNIGAERRINKLKVVCTEIGENLRFYVQHHQDGPQVEILMTNLQNNIQSLVPAALSGIKAGDVVAARFSEDKQWYRAKVEKKSGPDQYLVFYVDYGNRENVSSQDICQLPREFSLTAFPAHCHEYQLAFAKLPSRDDLKQESLMAVANEIINKTMNLNEEYKIGGVQAVTLYTPPEEDGGSESDVGLGLVSKGHLLALNRKEPKYQTIVEKYMAAEMQAKRSRSNMWCYGDITEDDH